MSNKCQEWAVTSWVSERTWRVLGSKLAPRVDEAIVKGLRSRGLAAIELLPWEPYTLIDTEAGVEKPGFQRIGIGFY